MAHKGTRQPHGTTLDAVFAEVRRLYYGHKPEPAPVSRSQLLAALKLPATTVDDRIRVLASEGRICKAGRGLYRPNMAMLRSDKPVQLSWQSGQVVLTVREHTLTLSEEDARDVVSRLEHFLNATARRPT